MRFYLITGILFFVFNLIIQSSGIDPYYTLKVVIYSILGILFIIYEIFKIKSSRGKLGKKLFIYDNRFSSKSNTILGIFIMVSFLALVFSLQGFSSQNIAINIWLVQIMVGGLYRVLSLKPWVLENGLIYHNGMIAWNEISSFRWKETSFGKRKGLIKLIIIPKPKIVRPHGIPIYVNTEVQPQFDKILNDVVTDLPK